LNGV
jgi:hypothetical protein